MRCTRWWHRNHLTKPPCSYFFKGICPSLHCVVCNSGVFGSGWGLASAGQRVHLQGADWIKNKEAAAVTGSLHEYWRAHSWCLPGRAGPRWISSNSNEFEAAGDRGHSRSCAGQRGAQCCIRSAFSDISDIVVAPGEQDICTCIASAADVRSNRDIAGGGSKPPCASTEVQQATEPLATKPPDIYI